MSFFEELNHEQKGSSLSHRQVGAQIRGSALLVMLIRVIIAAPPGAEAENRMPI